MPSPDTVIVLGDWNWSFMPERRQRLEQWVSGGGRLVVSRGPLADEEFNSWTGVTREKVEARDKKAVCIPGRPCSNEDGWATTDPGRSNRRWVICDLAQLSYLSTTRKVSWQLHDQRSHAQVLRIPVGRGSVTILNADPFEEQGPLCGDNALLFAAATQLHRGDTIEFLSEQDGESLLALIWRYGAPVVGLLAALIALWLWRSGVRFGPLMAVPDAARRSLAEQIRGTGQFTLRFGGGHTLHAAVARAFDETAARQVPHYDRLALEARLTTLAPLTGFGAGELSAALDRAATRNPNELRKAIATLELARRHMAQTTKRNN
jgi:hypothetical protein